MNVPDWLTEIGKIIIIIAKAFWNSVVVWAGMTIQNYAGEPAKWLYYLILFAVIPFVVITRSIAQMQAGIESFHASLASLFLKLLAIGLTVFIITFLLSQM